MKFLLPLLLASFASAETQPAKGLSAVRVQAGAGPVEVLADRETTSVNYEKIGADTEGLCKFSATRAGALFTLKAENAKTMGKSCKVGWRVIVPEALETSAASGSGNVSVRGLRVKTSASAGSGEISLESLRGGGSAKTGSGKIAGAGLSGDFTASTGSGDVSLAFSAAPRAISVTTGSGDVTVTLPKGSTLNLNAKTGSGKTTSALGSTPSGKTKIDAKTGSGNVAILEAQ